MRTFYTIAFVLNTLSCFSQQDQTTLWQNIELSLRTKNSLNTTSSRLQQLKQEAIKNKDAAECATNNDRKFNRSIVILHVKPIDTLVVYFI